MSSDGVPFVIDRFQVDGRVVSGDELETELETPGVPVTIIPPGGGAGPRRELMPADLSVVSFPELP
jgi:hypothetical protein